MKHKKLFKIPVPSLRRLPRYLHLLKILRDRGSEVVSTTGIAGDLKLDATKVRKDLSFTGVSGKPQVGYQIDELIDGIETFLGWRNTSDAFLVGAGHLATALLGYSRFSQYGLDIAVAFDVNPEVIGTEVHGRTVLDLCKFSDLAGRMKVHIGIITVPAEEAQSVADIMVKSGILAIWNFAPVNLSVPPGVLVQAAEMYAQLAVLSRHVENNLKNNSGGGHD